MNNKKRNAIITLLVIAAAIICLIGCAKKTQRLSICNKTDDGYMIIREETIHGKPDEQNSETR